MTYLIKWTKPALRDLKKFDVEFQKKIWFVIDKLKKEQVEIRKLTARDDEWRIRLGDYRIVVKFDKNEQTIYVESIKHRSLAYKNMK